MPNPADISIGPSDFSADPSENRLVRKCQPNTAISTTPKITQVVGCVNAAAIADQEQRRSRSPRRPRRRRNGSMSDSRNSTVMLSR